MSGTRDFILPAIGKLSFVVLEDVEMIKVKLYAYLSYADKYFFSDITSLKVKLGEAVHLLIGPNIIAEDDPYCQVIN